MYSNVDSICDYEPFWLRLQPDGRKNPIISLSECSLSLLSIIVLFFHIQIMNAPLYQSWAHKNQNEIVAIENRMKPKLKWQKNMLHNMVCIEWVRGTERKQFDTKVNVQLSWGCYCLFICHRKSIVYTLHKTINER